MGVKLKADELKAQLHAIYIFIYINIMEFSCLVWVGWSCCYAKKMHMYLCESVCGADNEYIKYSLNIQFESRRPHSWHMLHTHFLRLTFAENAAWVYFAQYSQTMISINLNSLINKKFRRHFPLFHLHSHLRLLFSLASREIGQKEMLACRLGVRRMGLAWPGLP